MLVRRIAPTTVLGQRRRKLVTFLAGYGFLFLLVLFAYRLSLLFNPLHAAFTLMLLGLIVLALAWPTVTLGLVIVLTIVGDQRAMPWWPFDKNLSSAESLLYTADALTIKPLELMLVGLLLIVLVNEFIGRARSRRAVVAAGGSDRRLKDPFLPAVLVFLFAVIFGLVRGIATGGDVAIAVLEGAFVLYVPLVFLAATRLFTTMAHYRRLLVAIIAGISIEAIHGVLSLDRLREILVTGVSPLNHTAALQMNLLFLALAATLVLRRKAWVTVAVLTVLAAPTLRLYLESQRRSAIVAALLGVVVLGVILYQTDRRRFKIVTPVLLVVFALYMGAFWNASGGVGFPARTVKNIVVPSSKEFHDAGSDQYRQFETFNVQMTIRSSPILGIGYGQEFLQPIPLPRLVGNFTFADFSPHNTFLGLWFKAGLAGFASYVYLLAAGTAAGIRGVLRARDPVDRVVIFVLIANLPMTLIVSYVEIAFDPPTTTLLGVSLALAATLHKLRDNPLMDDDEMLAASAEPSAPPRRRPGVGRGPEAVDDTVADGPERVPIGV